MQLWRGNNPIHHTEINQSPFSRGQKRLHVNNYQLPFYHENSFVKWYNLDFWGHNKILQPHKVNTPHGMMASSIGNIFRVTGPLGGESTSHPWIPDKGQWRAPLMVSWIYSWTNDWGNNQDTGDFRCHRAHYDVTVMARIKCSICVLLCLVVVS